MHGRISFGRVSGAVAAVLAATSLGLAAPANAAPRAAAAPRSYPNVMRLPGLRAAADFPPTETPHLAFVGGHVLSHAKVYIVLWGGGTYASQIARTDGLNLSDLMRKLTGGSYFDELSEYSTGAQALGNGSLGGVIHITPSANHNHQFIDDGNDIVPELESQVSHHKLPQPDDDTLFMLFFPRGKIITIGGIDSAEEFCGYHFFVPHLKFRMRYAVIPDMLSSACHSFIGTRISGLDMLTVVVSHELEEAATDPDISTWMDNRFGEIGDICSFQFPPARYAGYGVEMSWSNQAKKCVVGGPRRLVAVGDASVMETNLGKRMLRVPVTLSASSGQKVTMKYQLLNGTATGGATQGAGVDFDNHGGTLTFAPPAGHSQSIMTNYITVPVFGDTTAEADETLTVRLSSLSPGYGFARYRGTVTILNDDPTVGTAAFGVGDTVVRKSDKGNLTLPFVVTLSDPQVSTVTVDYTIAGVTATSGADFSAPLTGTLTFAPGHMLASVPVTVLSHSNTTQTLTLTLSNPSGGLSIARAVGTGTLAKNR